MPLAREHRNSLARAMRWSRFNGWAHDVYPNTFRSTDDRTHVRFDSIDSTLVIARVDPDSSPLRCRVTLVPVETPDVALNVLAALGHLPVELCPLGEKLLGDLRPDDTPDPGDPDPDPFDGPASFIEAGQAFADWVDGRVTAERAAEVLSKLARDGLIVSVAYHDEAVEDRAGEELAQIIWDDSRSDHRRGVE